MNIKNIEQKPLFRIKIILEEKTVYKRQFKTSKVKKKRRN